MVPRKEADGIALRRKYDRTSCVYDLFDRRWETRKYPRWRAMIFDSVRNAGTILDLGAGTGKNIPHYPPECRVVALDQSRGMLSRSLDRQKETGASALIAQGTAWPIEYELSRRFWPRLVMRLWTPRVRWLYGASFTRNVAARVPASGLEIAEKRWLSGDFVKLLVLRKPGPDFNPVHTPATFK